MVDLPRKPARRDVEMLARVLTAGGGEDQVVIRPNGVLVPRLEPFRTERGAPEFQADRTYIVTGGMGHIGRHVARFLARHGARSIVLTHRGRRRFERSESELRAELSAVGTTLQLESIDVTDGRATRMLIARQKPRVAGVFHCAGIIDEVPILSTTGTQLREILGPKVAGAWTLHEIARDLDIEHLVLFSSMASVLGGRGQGAYAAANAFMDGLASLRSARGLGGTSIAWGPWAGGGGMADRREGALIARIGAKPMQPTGALQMLGRVLQARLSGCLIADIDWATFKPVYEARRRSPILSDVGDEGLDGGVGQFEGERERLLGLPVEARAQVLRSLLGEELRRVLSTEVGDEDAIAQEFDTLGLDSLGAVQLRNRIQALLGRSVPPTLIFDHPSVPELVRFCVRNLDQEA